MQGKLPPQPTHKIGMHKKSKSSLNRRRTHNSLLPETYYLARKSEQRENYISSG